MEIQVPLTCGLSKPVLFVNVIVIILIFNIYKDFANLRSPKLKRNTEREGEWNVRIVEGGEKTKQLTELVSPLLAWLYSLGIKNFSTKKEVPDFNPGSQLPLLLSLILKVKKANKQTNPIKLFQIYPDLVFYVSPTFLLMDCTYSWRQEMPVSE